MRSVGVGSGQRYIPDRHLPGAVCSVHPFHHSFRNTLRSLRRLQTPCFRNFPTDKLSRLQRGGFIWGHSVQGQGTGGTSALGTEAVPAPGGSPSSAGSAQNSRGTGLGSWGLSVGSGGKGVLGQTSRPTQMCCFGWYRDSKALRQTGVTSWGRSSRAAEPCSLRLLLGLELP